MNINTREWWSTGTIIDAKWVLIERIATGGMGAVYRAHQLNLRRDVAIKLISEQYFQELQDNPDQVHAAIGRFHREVQVMAQVRHPNIVQIYDYGSFTLHRGDEGIPVTYIAMEYVPGNTLRFTMSEHGWQDEEELLICWLRRYFIPVLNGVEAIHNRGIIHRDLKPENVLMDNETPKIADFGLARSHKMPAVSNSWDVKGTWPYMAPEQFSDFRKAGCAADIYALGKILSEAVAGKMDAKQLPFKSVVLSNPRTPLLKALDDIIRRATAELSAQRHGSVAELRRQIQNALNIPRAPAPRDSQKPLSVQCMRGLCIGFGLAGLAIVGFLFFHMAGDTENRKQVPAISGKDNPSASKADIRSSSPTFSRVSPDGRTMMLVQASGPVDEFYSDPSLVTFSQYTKFLNAIAGEVTVSGGIVKQANEILIYLGDGTNAADQIFFKNHRFQLRKTQWACKPVVRVTWLGAQAYARHYGKRLPTFEEWKQLHQQIEKTKNSARESHNRLGDRLHLQSDHMSKHQHLADDSPTDAPTPAKEWLNEKMDTFASIRVVQWPSTGDRRDALLHYPWEGFTNVGFRTVMNFVS